MTAALQPRLTSLDERVLRQVRDRPRRVTQIAFAMDRPADEVRLILRGLEHLGRVEQRNGWWRRTA